MTEDLLKALYGVGIAALGLVSLVLAVVARYVPEMIRAFLESKRLINLERAGTISALAVEEKSKGASWTASGKQDAAQQLVRSIAPAATKHIGAVDLADVVKAGVAKMRASVPTPSLVPPPAFEVLRPPRVPKEEEEPT